MPKKHINNSVEVEQSVEAGNVMHHAGNNWGITKTFFGTPTPENYPEDFEPIKRSSFAFNDIKNKTSRNT